MSHLPAILGCPPLWTRESLGTQNRWKDMLGGVLRLEQSRRARQNPEKQTCFGAATFIYFEKEIGIFEDKPNQWTYHSASAHCQPAVASTSSSNPSNASPAPAINCSDGSPTVPAPNYTTHVVRAGDDTFDHGPLNKSELEGAPYYIVQMSSRSFATQPPSAFSHSSFSAFSATSGSGSSGSQRNNASGNASSSTGSLEASNRQALAPVHGGGGNNNAPFWCLPMLPPTHALPSIYPPIPPLPPTLEESPMPAYYSRSIPDVPDRLEQPRESVDGGVLGASSIVVCAPTTITSFYVDCTLFTLPSLSPAPFSSTP
ncbi:hypothetical protein OF83DRAFT_1178650 [Amylostereum chailletii]|nr:hypothetical protein OF83DRAFT_1178650 [Amylostereum chailletii]